MSQLCALWDVVADLTGQQVYLWSCRQAMNETEAELATVVVNLKASPPGKYPHLLALDWHHLGFSPQEAREWIRAGVRDPEDASRRKAQGCVIVHHGAGHPRIRP